MTPSTGFGVVEAVRSTATDMAGGGRGWILLSVSFGWFLGLGMRLAAPALVPYIRADFGIGLSTAGLLLSLLWVTYALLQLPGGILGDRIGERNVLVLSSVLAVAAVAASATAWSVAALFGAFVLLGSATGIYATTRFTSLVDVFPQRAGTATGLCSAAGNVGTVLLPAGAGLLAGWATWRLGFASAVPLFATAALALWFTVPPHTSKRGSAVDELSIETIRRLARGITNRRALVFTAAMFLMSVIYQGFTSFYPTYLVSIKGLSEGGAALVYSVFFAAGIAIQPIAGAAADTVGERVTMVGFSVATAIAFVVLVSMGGFWTLVGISILLSAQLGFWPIAQAAVIDALPTEMQGTGFGFLRTVYLLMAASTPALIGALGDRGLFDEAFLLLGGCAAITALLGLVFLRK